MNWRRILLTIAIGLILGAVVVSGIKSHSGTVNLTIKQLTQSKLDYAISATVYVEAHGNREQMEYYYGYDRGSRLWSGSGVNVAADVLILTAGHVVGEDYENVEYFRIVLNDGTEYISTTSFKSDTDDCAYIDIDPNEAIPYLEFSDYDEQRVGDYIYVIGSPFGYELFNSVTKGIISGFSRDIPFFGEKGLLQVDAAANGGNSGGPVINEDGDIIGILIGGYVGADGIGLCTPSNVCEALLKIYDATLEYMNI